MQSNDRRGGAMLLAAAVIAVRPRWRRERAACIRPGCPSSARRRRPRRRAPTRRPASPAAARAPRTTTSPRLPADSVTDHTVELPGRTLHFKATAGSIPLNDAESGALQAEIAYVAYVMGVAADDRPVTFLFNGGPGAASAYLDIGAVGPWRLPLDNITFSASPRSGPTPRPGSTSPISCSSIRSAPATAASRPAATTCAGSSIRSTATPTRSR